MHERKPSLQGPLQQHCRELLEVNDPSVLEGGLYVF